MSLEHMDGVSRINTFTVTLCVCIVCMGTENFELVDESFWQNYIFYYRDRFSFSVCLSSRAGYMVCHCGFHW